MPGAAKGALAKVGSSHGAQHPILIPAMAPGDLFPSIAERLGKTKWTQEALELPSHQKLHLSPESFIQLIKLPSDRKIQSRAF